MGSACCSSCEKKRLLNFKKHKKIKEEAKAYAEESKMGEEDVEAGLLRGGKQK